MKEDNVLIVIIGITGDLSRRYLLPALHKLVAHKKIKNFSLIGVSRHKENPARLLKEAKKFSKQHFLLDFPD